MRKAPLASLALFACVTTFAQQQVPQYRAMRTVDPIAVDGNLSEFTWALAPRVGRFVNIRDLKRKDIAATEAALAWNDAYLYVAFACHDYEPWGTMTGRDDHLWNEEVVEVFLDPDGDGRDYAELEVSPHGVVVDLLIPEPRQGIDEAIQWDIEGLKSAVSRHEAGWAAEIAIPWTSLRKAGVHQAPHPGDKWRVGLYRIERPGGRAMTAKIEALRRSLNSAAAEARAAIEAELAQLEADLQWLAWSPTRVDRGFHDPERFGVVEFAP